MGEKTNCNMSIFLDSLSELIDVNRFDIAPDCLEIDSVNKLCVSVEEWGVAIGYADERRHFGDLRP
jgi:hypothetical protein